MKIRLQSNQYIKNCSTDKAYAIDFSKYGDNSMVFLPKSKTKFEEVKIEKDGSYWTTEYNVEFPDWLFDKMNDSQKMTIDFILDQWTETEEEWEAECEHQQNEQLGINDDYQERAL